MAQEFEHRQSGFSAPVLTPKSIYFLLFIKQYNCFIIGIILLKGQTSLYLYMLSLKLGTQFGKSLAR